MTSQIGKPKIFGFINILFRLFLGGMLLLGGIDKFEKPIPSPTSQFEKITKGEIKTDNLEELQIQNYIFGMKQTDYFWQFLGITEIAFGLLIISQIFGLLGAFLSLPLTINIFLFHAFLEPNETSEIIKVGLLLAINLWLIGYEYKRWKSILFNKNIFS